MRLKLLLTTWVVLFLVLPGMSLSTLWAETLPVDGITESVAQVSGTVTAKDGTPLAGATVLAKGTVQGTFTDGEGKYSLDVPEGVSTLIVSYIGYQAQEVDINGRSVINVSLESEISFLDEVVVTGYGTLKGKEVTGSITSVKAKDFNVGNINDPAQLLQGKVAGLTISRPGANPNGNFSIRLRGLSTIGASTEPLIVIDGVLGGNLNSIEPQDIASIDVLKDGSAAAIYGTRGASGVILITTKKGIAGTSSVNYSGQFTLETVDRVVDVLNAAEYKAFPGSNDLGGNVDWFDEIMQTGMSNTHNLSLSGGTASTSYRISGNYRNVQGIARKTGFERINGRVNLSQKALNDRLKVTINLATTTEDADLGFDQAFRYATIYNPTAPFIRDENNADFERWDGYFQQVLFDFYNPVAMIEQNTNERQTKTLIANVRGDYNLTDDLQFSLFYSQQRANTVQGQYFDKQSFWTGQNRNGLARRQNDESEDQLFRAELNYNKSFAGNTSLKVLAAYEYQDFIFQGFRAEGGNFLTDAFGFNNLSAAQDFANGLGNVTSYKNRNTLIAFFGRVNLNIDDKIFATASARREGSSRFGAENKWGLFPAVSVGADLVRLAGISAFDNLKLRAGYGVTGSNIGDSYRALQRFGPTGNFFFNGGFVPSYGPVSNANPDLRWQTKTDLNIGVDFALLGYKLSGSLEYYTTTTKDLILNFDVPVPPNLFQTTWLNIGQLDNSGIELALNYAMELGGDNALNFGFNANRFFPTILVSLSDEARGLDFGGQQERANLGSPGQNGTRTILVEEGQPIGQIWTLVLDQNQLVKDDGTWNVLDTDGDGTVDKIKDRDIVGNGLPKYQLGFNTSLTAGNWDVNVFFRSVLGHDLLNTFRAFYEAPSTINAYNILASSTEVATLTDQPQLADYHVESADFLKLDNLTIGYSVPSAPGGFKSIRLFANAQNLLTLTNYKGVSPEPRLVDSNGNDPLSPGLDRRNTYFSARGFNIGVNLGF
ncbi:MAG: SusC/RagA family TonB-linked outer membrane protein [Bacteroidota bacterium]